MPYKVLHECFEISCPCRRVADRRTDGAVSDLNPPDRASTKPALSAAEVGAMNPWSCKNRPPACNRRQEHSEVSRPHENRPQRTGSVSMFEFGLCGRCGGRLRFLLYSYTIKPRNMLPVKFFLKKSIAVRHCSHIYAF